MLVIDPPDHTRLRRLVSKAFTPHRIAKLEDRIKAVVGELLDAAEARGSLELMNDFAAPLPAVVIAELLGVPPEERDQFKAWSTVLIASLGNRTTAEVVPESEAALKALFGYLEDIIAQRRREPRDDLISAMVLAQEENDALSDGELLATTNLLLLAGLETTTNLIGNGLLALLRDPEAFEALRMNDALLETAIEEMLRFDGPVQGTVRVALEDIEFSGHTIPEGALVFASIGAANRDPDVFENPDKLDLARDPNPHLAFGVGTHFCLGAALARLEARVAFRGLQSRFPNMKLATETPQYRSNPILRGLSSLPLQI
jgi:cytochrome P450